MFCPKCGAKLPDGASFCTSCGATLGGVSSQPAYTQPQYAQSQPQYAPAQPAYAQPQYAQTPYAPQALPDPRRAGSPLLLIAAILFTLATGGRFVSYCINVFKAIDGGWFGYNAVYFIMTFCAYCVSLALIVSIWLAFIKSKSRAEPLPVGGALSIARAMIIVSLVFEILQPTAQFIFNAVRRVDVTYNASFFYDPLIFATLYVFAIVAIGAIKKSKGGAAVVITAILCFIVAAADAYGEVKYYAGSGAPNGFDVLVTCSVVMSVVATILFGILLLVYNGAAKRAAR